MIKKESQPGNWVVVARIPQLDGGMREVLVEKCNASEVKRVIQADPVRVQRLWCPTQVRDIR